MSLLVYRRVLGWLVQLSTDAGGENPLQVAGGVPQSTMSLVAAKILGNEGTAG